ncbi:hypothetical protein N9J84_05290 [Porticoccaceae bacterium]|nr:hypothetical protein [Porticoccaceae bacterium]
MKYLLPLLLLAGLANAGEEPKEGPQIYLYIVMNGTRSHIEVLNDKHDTLESCERAIENSKQNHAKAVVICGKDLQRGRRKITFTKSLGQ